MVASCGPAVAARALEVVVGAGRPRRRAIEIEEARVDDLGRLVELPELELVEPDTATALRADVQGHSFDDTFLEWLPAGGTVHELPPGGGTTDL